MIIIRHAASSDVETLADANVALAAESEGTNLDLERARLGARAVVHDEAKGTYFVASLAARDGDARGDGRILAGSLLVTREWSDWRAGWYWWIQSVYVWPEARRRGVYAALHAHVLGEARAHGALAVRLYVERQNTRAHHTYASLGMRRASYEIWEQDT